METLKIISGKEQKNDIHTTIFNVNGREEKRNILKGLSQDAKLILELNPDAGKNVNDVILKHFYTNAEHQEFNTFKGWIEKGFKVKKGSKAFFIWSKPKTVTKKIESDNEKEKDEFKMFGIAHLFSNAQIEPLE